MTTTRIDAVNICLSAKGEAPVNTIPTAGVSEASIANNVLNTISREVQTKGLRCNTLEGYTLALTSNKELVLPSDEVLHVDPTDKNKDYVQRGNRLYDRENFTYKFEESCKVDMIVYLDFEELPEHVRYYIAVRSARKYQRDFLGSNNLNGMSMEDEQQALVNFHRGEGLTDDRSMLDNRDVALTHSRRRMR